MEGSVGKRGETCPGTELSALTNTPELGQGLGVAGWGGGEQGCSLSWGRLATPAGSEGGRCLRSKSLRKPTAMSPCCVFGSQGFST